ncbi:MAG: hypothetical protein PHY56_00960 [Candidatus Omnitrophica bacterium]|jgi:hypothetical protein|nr:hypothetical protein [Candidatus Omnitrophota bacterium]
MDVVIGIDVGLNGAIAVLIGGSKPMVYPIPTYKDGKGKNRYDYNALCRIFEHIKYNTVYGSIIGCALERCTAMPKQGSVSGFSFGEAYGFYKGVLTALSIPYEIVQPKKWQQEFSISNDTKKGSFAVASRLYPNLELQTPRGRVLDGACDALLLATYMARKLKGEINAK